jgi:phosphatidylinositol alpha 1,6-mannosyltransferase
MTDTPRGEMRIAYFAGTMRPGHDGVTRVLYRLIDGLVQRNIPAIFFSPIVPSPAESPVPIHHVPSIQFPLYRDYRVAYPGFRHFENTLRQFRPDVIHINSPCSLGYAAARYGQRHGIPVAATYHTHFPSYARYYKIKPLEMLGWNYLRGLYNGFCNRVFVPSEPILAELAGQGMRNLRYLPHGVDSVSFHPRFRSPEWKSRLGIAGRSAVLFAGRLVWEKDLATLAEAYRILRQRRNDMAFVLVGDGPARKDLEALMPGAVFLGHQSGEELSIAFASSDVFAFPSTTETFGNVTVEAMASGVVPVCAREGGAYGVVRELQTGLITRPRDPEHLADAIGYLLDRPGERARMADQALAFARHLSWENIFDQLFEDYRSLVADMGTRRRRKRAA